MDAVERLREMMTPRWGATWLINQEDANAILTYIDTKDAEIAAWKKQWNGLCDMVASKDARIAELETALRKAIDFAEGLHETYDYLGTGSSDRLAEKEFADNAKIIDRLRTSLKGSNNVAAD